MSNFAIIEKPRVSCALGGALATVNALPRTVPILHASFGCGNMTSVAAQGAAGYLGTGYCGGNSIPSSAIGEKEIVFGGMDRLSEQIHNSAEIIDADLFAVITGCTAEIIGDDSQAVVRDYNTQRADHPPAILVSGAGFKGDSLWGYEATLESLFRDYVSPTNTRTKGRVNVWGVPPAQDVWWQGNLIEIRRLLEGIGLDVNTFFTPLDTLEQIRAAAQAELNIVLSPSNGVTAAKVFEAKHKTPYLVADLPIGIKATEPLLREIVQRLNLDQDRAGDFLQRERLNYYRTFNRLADAYSDIDLQRYAVVIGNANYAHALTRFVTHELGWIVELTVITDQLDESEKAAIEKRLEPFIDNAQRTVVFETDTSLIAEHLASRWPRSDGSRYHHPFSPAFVLGSRLDRDFAESIGAGHLSVSYPASNRVALNRGYAGYHGALTLVEDIYSVVLNSR